MPILVNYFFISRKFISDFSCLYIPYVADTCYFFEIMPYIGSRTHVPQSSGVIYYHKLEMIPLSESIEKVSFNIRNVK